MAMLLTLWKKFRARLQAVPIYIEGICDHLNEKAEACTNSSRDHTDGDSWDSGSDCGGGDGGGGGD